jgi:hypothetical protein
MFNEIKWILKFITTLRVALKRSTLPNAVAYHTGPYMLVLYSTRTQWVQGDMSFKQILRHPVWAFRLIAGDSNPTMKETQMPRKKQIYWYFAEESETLRYDDNRKIILGETHTVKGQPELCKHGLHASKHPFDALEYAPGNILYQVELSGKVIHGGDKSVALERKYLRKIDAEPILREFARWCASQVIHLWDCPPVVEEYLETGNEGLRDAAWAAADAARAAAWAAWAAADAARAAADAARDAARDAQRQKLMEMLEQAEWVEKG